MQVYGLMALMSSQCGQPYSTVEPNSLVPTTVHILQISILWNHMLILQ